MAVFYEAQRGVAFWAQRRDAVARRVPPAAGLRLEMISRLSRRWFLLRRENMAALLAAL